MQKQNRQTSGNTCTEPCVLNFTLCIFLHHEHAAQVENAVKYSDVPGCCVFSSVSTNDLLLDIYLNWQQGDVLLLLRCPTAKESFLSLHHGVVPARKAPREKPRTKSPSVLHILLLDTLAKSLTTIVTQIAQSRMDEDR
ncbi:hypothetical protein KXD40_002448 [Peronospora effusa]|nr:hypothetical protein KXD40_002448 [Peronospora effusa]